MSRSGVGKGTSPGVEVTCLRSHVVLHLFPTNASTLTYCNEVKTRMSTQRVSEYMEKSHLKLVENDQVCLQMLLMTRIVHLS